MLSLRRAAAGERDPIWSGAFAARARGAQSLPGNGAPLPSIDGGGGDGGAAKAARTMPHKSATLVCFSTDTAMKGCASASAWIWGSGHGRRSVLLHTFGKSGAGAAGEASGRGMAREGERASAAAVTASARLGGAYHDRRPLSVCAQVVCDVLGERGRSSDASRCYVII